MEIDVKMRKVFYEGSTRLRAIVSITLGGVLAIHEIKVIQGDKRLFVAMPSRLDENGKYRDIVHPINEGFRQQIEDAVLRSYQAELENTSLSENQQENS